LLQNVKSRASVRVPAMFVVNGHVTHWHPTGCKRPCFAGQNTAF